MDAQYSRTVFPKYKKKMPHGGEKMKGRKVLKDTCFVLGILFSRENKMFNKYL